MRRGTGWIWPALVLVAIVLAEAIPPLKQLDQAIGRHEQALLAVTLGLAALGFVLMMGSVLSLLMASGEPMSHEEVEGVFRRQRDTAAWPYTWRASAYRVLGSATGRQAEMESSFAGIKEAWRSGEWRRDTSWRRFFIAATGGALLFIGLFGIFLVMGPMPIKLVVGSAMIYAIARTASGFRRA